MKKYSVKNIGLAGLLVLLMPVIGFAASIESDVKTYLQENKPEGLDNYPPVFEHVYSKHAPVIKESTYVTVLYYFTTADDPKIDDEIVLASNAVTSAIAKADAEMAEAKAKGEEVEDRRGFYITDAVCGAFKGALSAAYKQTTAAWKAVEGSMKAALASGVEPSLAATVVSRGIDTCLDEKLSYEVWMYVQHGLNTGLSGTGATFSYLAPSSAYLSPAGLNREYYPVFENEVCVENCVGQAPVPPVPPLPPLPPVPSPTPTPSPSPSPCVSNCI